MTKEQAQEFKLKIEARLQETEEAIAAFKIDIVESTQNQTNYLQDGLTHAQELSTQEARIELHERNMNMRSQLRLALDRIRQGKFGVCVECHDNIDPRRLEAIPNAACCMECTFAQEHQSHMTPFNSPSELISSINFSLRPVYPKAA